VGAVIAGIAYHFKVGEKMALESELVLVRDSLDRVRTEASQVVMLRSFLDVQAKDSLVLALQGEVRRLKGRLGRAGGTAIGAEAVTRVDTVLKVEGDTASGRVSSTFDLRGWVLGRASLAGDSLGLELSVRNSYLATVGMERKWLLGRLRPVVEVVNLNPYTETVALKAVVVGKPTGSTFALGPAVGIGLAPNGRVYPTVGAYLSLRF